MFAAKDMPVMREPEARMVVPVPRSHIAAIDHLASRGKTTRKDVLRRAVRDYLERQGLIPELAD